MKRYITCTLAIICLFILLGNKESKACFSRFKFDRAGAGDTVIFFPIDPTAVYCWTFGDSLSDANVSFDKNAWHVYSQPGTYYVTLFTNIGAEWDYYTAEVIVTSQSFLADYRWDCYSAQSISFSDYSVGDVISWDWNFGDPGSGVNNTSILKDPSHTFTSAGNYNVRLIISDGIQNDTVLRTIQVYNSHISAAFGQMPMLPCAGDTFIPYPGFSGSITLYNWDFGDPASGLNNFSALQAPKHIYQNLGMYKVKLVISDGAQNDTAYLFVEVKDCKIWPGDANRDGEVNGDDIFPLGLYSGNTGTLRPGATSNFTPQDCSDWPGFQNFMYLQDFENAKHADCNGNGTIDSNDIAVISTNFGLKSDSVNNASQLRFVSAWDTELGFADPTIDAVSGATLQIPVTLGIEDSAARVYGFSFRVAYDPSFVQSVTVDFGNSQLGIPATDMISLWIEDNSVGLTSIAAVRTNHIVAPKISGEIAMLNFQLVPGITGTFPVTILPDAKVISNGMAPYITNQMYVIPVEIRNMQLDVYTGLAENEMMHVSVFPNPVSDAITIKIPGGEIDMVEIYNVQGQRILQKHSQKESSSSFSVADLAPGLYIIHVVSGSITGKAAFVKE